MFRVAPALLCSNPKSTADSGVPSPWQALSEPLEAHHSDKEKAWEPLSDTAKVSAYLRLCNKPLESVVSENN